MQKPCFVQGSAYKNGFQKNRNQKRSVNVVKNTNEKKIKNIFTNKNVKKKMLRFFAAWQLKQVSKTVADRCAFSEVLMMVESH